MNYQSVRVETAGQFIEMDPNISLSRSVFSLLSFVCQCDTPPKCAKNYKADNPLQSICVVIPETVVVFPLHHVEVER